MCTSAMAVSALARGRAGAQAGSRPPLMHAHTLAMAASSLVGRQVGLAQDADVVEGLWGVLAGWPGHAAVFSLLLLC